MLQWLEPLFTTKMNFSEKMFCCALFFLSFCVCVCYCCNHSVRMEICSGLNPEVTLCVNGKIWTRNPSLLKLSSATSGLSSLWSGLDVILCGWLGSKHQLTNFTLKVQFVRRETSPVISLLLVTVYANWDIFRNAFPLEVTVSSNKNIPRLTSPLKVQFFTHVKNVSV